MLMRQPNLASKAVLLIINVNFATAAVAAPKDCTIVTIMMALRLTDLHRFQPYRSSAAIKIIELLAAAKRQDSLTVPISEQPAAVMSKQYAANAVIAEIMSITKAGSIAVLLPMRAKKTDVTSALINVPPINAGTKDTKSSKHRQAPAVLMKRFAAARKDTAVRQIHRLVSKS